MAVGISSSEFVKGKHAGQSLGHLRVRESHVDSALQQHRHALELNPGDYGASWEAARIALLDNPQDALEFATRALELKPDIAEPSRFAAGRWSPWESRRAPLTT